MKVLNLQCSQRHSFEGWFGSEDDFQSQMARGLVECPLCADKAVLKMPSAPRLNFGSQAPPAHESVQASSSAPAGVPAGPNTERTTAQATEGSIEHTSPGQITEQSGQGAPSLEHQALFIKAVRHVLANTEDVGNRFADQARAMHYGDVAPRSIRGQATPHEAAELLEEGIDVMALPVPAALKETLQ